MREAEKSGLHQVAACPSKSAVPREALLQKAGREEQNGGSQQARCSPRGQLGPPRAPWGRCGLMGHGCRHTGRFSVTQPDSLDMRVHILQQAVSSLRRLYILQGEEFGLPKQKEWARMEPATGSPFDALTTRLSFPTNCLHLLIMEDVRQT